jgi:hypothetical protein
MASPQLHCMDSPRKREHFQSHGSKARIMISLSFDSLRSSIGLIKEARAFSKPWFKGEDYDLSLSFDSPRSSIGLIKEARAFSKPWFKGEDYDLSLFRFA